MSDEELMAAFDDAFFTDDFRPRTPEEDLLEVLKNGQARKAYALLRSGVQPVTEPGRRCCLTAALHCSKRLFCAVLALCPDGEYADEITLKSPLGPMDWVISGTTVTLAAALGRADLVQVLLDRGWDVNGNGVASQAAHMRRHKGDPFGWPMEDGLTAEVFCGGQRAAGGDMESNDLWRGCHGGTLGTTPLAAAIYFGREAVVACLMKRKGLWLGEAVAVSKAYIAMCLPPRSPVYAGIAASLRGTAAPGHLLPGMTAGILGVQGQIGLLRELYDSGGATQTQALCLLRRLSGGEIDIWEQWPDRAVDRDIFLFTLRKFPALLEYAKLRARYIELLIAAAGQPNCHRMARFYQLHRGAELELGPVLDVLGSNSPQGLTLLLDRLKGLGFHVVLAEDSVFDQVPDNLLRVLLRKVEIRPSHRAEGVSGLARAVLTTGSLALVRRELQRGCLQRARTDEMLSYLARQKSNSPLRAILLARAQKGETCYVL